MRLRRLCWSLDPRIMYCSFFVRVILIFGRSALKGGGLVVIPTDFDMRLSVKFKCTLLVNVMECRGIVYFCPLAKNNDELLDIHPRQERYNNIFSISRMHRTSAMPGHHQTIGGAREVWCIQKPSLFYHHKTIICSH